MTEVRGLYAITDPLLTPGDRLFEACEAALRGGATLLQYRDKHASQEERRSRAAQLQRLCRRQGALFIVNDDPGLAAWCGADGVHIGQRDGAIKDARAHLGARAIIGVSCHADLELAREAQRQGASYVALGRFFVSHTKPEAPPATLDTLRQASRDLSLPVVAIGGATPDNAAQLVQAGASAVAAIHGLFAGADIEQCARRFSALFHAH